MDEFVGKDVALSIQKKPTYWQSHFEPFSVYVSVMAVLGDSLVVRDRTGMSRSIPVDDEYMKILDIREV